MRKRSKYRPKGVRLDPIRYVLEGMKPMANHPAALDLRIKNHDALANITRGNATRGDMDVLISALNMAEAMAILGIGADYRGEIRAAQDAVLAMARRGIERNNRFLFTGQEMQAVNLAMEIHDAQIEAATVADLEKAIDKVQLEIQHKRARAIVETQQKQEREVA